MLTQDTEQSTTPSSYLFKYHTFFAVYKWPEYEFTPQTMEVFPPVTMALT